MFILFIHSPILLKQLIHSTIQNTKKERSISQSCLVLRYLLCPFRCIEDCTAPELNPAKPFNEINYPLHTHTHARVQSSEEYNIIPLLQPHCADISSRWLLTAQLVHSTSLVQSFSAHSTNYTHIYIYIYFSQSFGYAENGHIAQTFSHHIHAQSHFNLSHYRNSGLQCHLLHVHSSQHQNSAHSH